MRQRTIRTGKLLALLLLVSGAGVAGGVLSGCSVPPSTTEPCALISVMNPAMAVADHSAAAPANSVTFDVGYAAASGSGTSCGIPQIVYLPTMTTSDPVNVTLSTPGVATCVGTTTVPAILTDKLSKATATLTCK